MLSFAPDLPKTTPEVLTDVSAVPTPRGYRSPPVGLSDGSAAVASATQGGALLLKLDGSTRTLTGTSAALYELSGGSWSDVSAGGGYSAGTARWRFTIYGNTALAINKATQLQSSTSGAFAAVANSPKAACMDVCQGFVILGNCDDSSTGLSTGYGDQPHRWWISQYGAPTSTWAPSASTQATSGLLVETPGAITVIKRLAGEVIAYKGRGLYVGRFTGSQAVLEFRCVSTDIGCQSGDAVVAAGGVHYFPGDDDFYAFDGTRPVPIGGPAKEWFFSEINRAYISSIQSLHDRVNSLIYWFYPGGSTSALTGCICYHYETRRWGHFDIAVSDVLEAVTSSITYDNLGTLFSTYDALDGIAYDSPFWNANTPVLGYMDSSHKLYSLSGNGGALSLTTGWVGQEDVVTLCDRVRPKYRTKPSSATLTPSTCFDLGGATYAQTAVTVNSDRFDVLQSGRYHQFTLLTDDQAEVEAVAVRLKPDSDE